MATLSSFSLPKPKNKDDEIKKERVRKIISSLPKAKGWVTPYLYQYQDFWYMYASLEATILVQHNFKFKKDDVLMATNPKYGTTCIKALAYAIMNRATYQNDHSTQLSLTNNPHALIPKIDSPLFQKFGLEDLKAMHFPRLFGTHMPYNLLPESVISLGCRVVYMCWDPKDMFVSMWHFSDKSTNTETPLIPMKEALDFFCDEISYLGPYWDHVLGYYKASLEFTKKILFLKYEGMRSDNVNNVKRLAKFLGKPISLEEEEKWVVLGIIQLCCFENMRNLELNTNSKLFGEVKNDLFYRKCDVEDSKNYLNVEMIERLN